MKLCSATAQLLITKCPDAQLSTSSYLANNGFCIHLYSFDRSLNKQLKFQSLSISIRKPQRLKKEPFSSFIPGPIRKSFSVCLAQMEMRRDEMDSFALTVFSTGTTFASIWTDDKESGLIVLCLSISLSLYISFWSLSFSFFLLYDCLFLCLLFFTVPLFLNYVCFSHFHNFIRETITLVRFSLTVLSCFLLLAFYFFSLLLFSQ